MKTCLNTHASIGLLLILCAAPFASASAASAEPAGMTGPADGLAPREILAIVRSSGFDPVSRPVRNGRTFTLRALDRYELELNLVVDARTGRVVSAKEAAAPPYAARGGLRPAYSPYGAPVYARIFGSPEAGFGSPRPPRTVPGAQVVPSVAGVKPQEKAAARAPLPRPRPYVVEATGSVPAAADTAVVQANPAPTPPAVQKPNGGVSMPPIAPLD